MFLVVLCGILLLLLVGFLLLCNKVGCIFVKNLSRKNPGEKFSADIDVSFYEKSPVRKLAQEGLAYMDALPQEDVYITSQDGLKLHATVFPAEDSPKKFVLGIHGFQSHARNEYAPHIAFYRSIGFSMLLPDDRAHGYSEGQYITLGVKDRLDCVSWAKYLVERYGEDIQILLHGVSMGGATVLSASGEADLPPQVIGVVSDCGFTSVEAAFTHELQSMFHIPPALPVKICGWYAKHKAGFDFNEARPIDQVKKAKVPIFFVQGADDFLVPQEMARQLYESCSAPKRLLIVEHANHAESIAIDPEGYHQAIHELFGI